MSTFFKYFLVLICLLAAPLALANIRVPIYLMSKEGRNTQIGTVIIDETKYGLLFLPHLQGLKPGIHGFHIHENPSCDNAGMNAGGHWDPQNTGLHLGPYNDDGHLGDLPALYVDADGTATLPVLAPRIMRIEDILDHTLMVHEGGDNYSDAPQKLGGGAARMGCGVIKQ